MSISRRGLLAAASAATLLRCASTPLRRSAASPRSVVVLGAGLAGLAAGFELGKRGFDVRILEAQDRPGGRIRTLRSPFPEGLYVEAGATHVVGDPDLLSLISELNVKLTRPTRSRWPNRVMFRRGVRSVAKPGEELPEEGPKLREDEASLDFKGLLEKYFGSPLEHDPRTADWSRPELAGLDGLTAEQFLIDRGASEGYRRMAEASFCPNGSLRTISALALIREALNFQLEIGWADSQRVAGGTDALPHALAQRLGDRIIFGAEARRIDQTELGTVVSFDRNGKTEQLSARHVVCALPGSVVSRLEMNPPLHTETARAFSDLNAVSVSRVYVATKTRYWNERGESGNAESDLTIGFVHDEAAAQKATAGILGVYATGDNARRLSSLAESERHRTVVEQMERVHPGLTEQLLAVRSVCWDNERLFRGAYTWLGLHQLSKQQPLLRRPHGAIHFAGEYNSHRPGFMHGALASAKRAVAAIVERQELLKG